jgi:hypothetical protein
VWVESLVFNDWKNGVEPIEPVSSTFAFDGTLPTNTSVQLTSQTRKLFVPVALSSIGVWRWKIGYTVPGYPLQTTFGESSMPPIGGPFDTNPVSFWGDYEVYNGNQANPSLSVHSIPDFGLEPWETTFTSNRTGGLSTD